jgi:hypothetical protein
MRDLAYENWKRKVEMMRGHGDGYDPKPPKYKPTSDKPELSRPRLEKKQDTYETKQDRYSEYKPERKQDPEKLQELVDQLVNERLKELKERQEHGEM